MSKIISIYNGSSATIMELNCPKCNSVVDVNLPKFVIAINKQESFWCAHCWSKFTFKVELLDPRSPTLRAPVHAEQNGASELVCTFDNDGGGIDIDVLKKMLKGKHGFLMAKPYANGQVQFSMTPHSNRSAGG